MQTKIAKIISVIFHPMLMPTYGIILMFSFPTYLQSMQYELKKAIVLIVFLSTFITPLLAFLMLTSLKIIKSIELADKKERLIPYAVALAFLSGTLFLFLNFPANIPSYIFIFLLLSIIGLVILTLLNFWIKVSAHSSGASGLFAFFTFFLFQFNLDPIILLLPAAIITGIISWARLQLNAHTPKEIYLGILAGVFTGSLPFWVF